MSYWMQVNENRAIVESVIKSDDQVEILEFRGFIVLIGKENDVAKICGRGCLTVSDEGEGKPKINQIT